MNEAARREVPVYGSLAGGVADVGTGRPYGPDTLQLVFSTTKGVTAICVHGLVERGDLDLDAPVADYWPESAQAGKGDLPVRMLLCHQAGLPVVVDRRLGLADILEIDPIVQALAAQKPISSREARTAITRSSSGTWSES